jgi:formate dehydrogenase subunit beta
MDTQWTIKTNGDPLGAVRGFMTSVWSQANLDGMLVLSNGAEHAVSQPRLIDEPAGLEEVNPFKPLMTVNAARLIPEMIQDHPQARLGAMLRPCEMRALVEMVKHDSFSLEGFLTVSVDCLGTYPLDEYKWRAARKDASGGPAAEPLQFARQGGIVAYRYRSACQVCQSPEAQGADLNIHVIGLPVRQHILVSARDEPTAGRLRLDAVADKPASPELVEQHSHVLARLSERHQRTMERVTQSLGEVMPHSVEALIDQLENCGSCQRCMNVCPICSVDYPVRDAQGRYERQSIVRWLVSCAGCGMCEQACTSHLPLSAIFGHIREVLSEELDYMPGRSWEGTLPL